jgi:hypothetical protein
LLSHESKTEEDDGQLKQIELQITANLEAIVANAQLIADLTARVDVLEQENQAQQAEIDTNTSTNTTQDNEITQLEADNVDQDSRIDDNEDGIVDNADRIDDAEELIDDNAVDIADHYAFFYNWVNATAQLASDNAGLIINHGNRILDLENWKPGVDLSISTLETLSESFVSTIGMDQVVSPGDLIHYSLVIGASWCTLVNETDFTLDPGVYVFLGSLYAGTSVMSRTFIIGESGEVGPQFVRCQNANTVPVYATFDNRPTPIQVRYSAGPGGTTITLDGSRLMIRKLS